MGVVYPYSAGSNRGVLSHSGRCVQVVSHLPGLEFLLGDELPSPLTSTGGRAPQTQAELSRQVLYGREKRVSL